ncbi:energy-coupling factor transporter ATPase [Aquibacillus koreensis]|uniref:Energy-coupling factor transporter ATP-binding protein EcfA2 n=1 Tax=Aquibacillus koreensis TaxID=279446 RepID=A0A9X3WMA7_9BACI|nr:energy-coupling factor transporter ATPase [Aquibacillus koreensis]MCT2534295.1 energy-coupling factor transporter ATPase [Aquibacillus koreensis]MDC3422372.1 energy-coupling factor transporter ATPase [Aquibacillus koreensis]
MEIKFDKVTADYQLGPIRSPRVLESVDLLLETGSFTAVIGHTGSGKSSLLKAMNGLLLPREGKITVGDSVIESEKSKKAFKKVRKQVGMVFQFPESQLFAETIEQDICFGPLNFGVPLKEAKEIALHALEQVGLDPGIRYKSPFSLSGGQKRRVAIAGILAMRPEVLVLDEPGAGLDPKGKSEIMSLITSWHNDNQLTTVLVTHDMEDVATYAEDVIVMNKGKIVVHDRVRNLFANQNVVEKWGLDVPEARRMQLMIERETGVTLPSVCLTTDELADALMEVGLV